MDFKLSYYRSCFDNNYRVSNYYKMNTQEINELIEPFQIFYDESSKRNYYFNS